MQSLNTPLGTLKVGDRVSLFESFAREVDRVAATADASASVAFSGGSTPRAWFEWATAGDRFQPKALRNLIWTTSDERHVELSSESSNFGNVVRHFLDPLGFEEDKHLPWPVEFDPVSGALTYQSQWFNRFGRERCYDLCMLGMGEDCHTASLFPGSPLLQSEGAKDFFAAVEVPDKGWRYTVTPGGLRACGAIVVMVLGQSKREALAAALNEKIDIEKRPLQLLSRFPDKVTLLCDEAAAASLSI